MFLEILILINGCDKHNPTLQPMSRYCELNFPMWNIQLMFSYWRLSYKSSVNTIEIPCVLQPCYKKIEIIWKVDNEQTYLQNKILSIYFQLLYQIITILWYLLPFQFSGNVQNHTKWKHGLNSCFSNTPLKPLAIPEFKIHLHMRKIDFEFDE